MPDRYIARKRPHTIYGMPYEVIREGARWPIALAATPTVAGIFAEILTKATEMADASWNDVTAEVQEFVRGEALSKEQEESREH